MTSSPLVTPTYVDQRKSEMREYEQSERKMSAKSRSAKPTLG